MVAGLGTGRDKVTVCVVMLTGYGQETFVDRERTACAVYTCTYIQVHRHTNTHIHTYIHNTYIHT